MTPLRVAAVIPARFASTRFPGKPLADLTGKPLILHVLDRAAECTTVSRVIVATDDERIHETVLRAGFESRMTRADHPNGTSRIAEIAETLDEDLIVNIQGDEPQIEPELVDRTVTLLASRPDVNMATLVSPFATGEDPANPNIVKCVCAVDGRALYFSRSVIPFNRDGAPDAAQPLKHVGLYVYRRSFLSTFLALSPTPLERTESLEQLRVLEHGHTILCAHGEAHFTGIDTFCPGPLMELISHIKHVAVGDVIELLSTDQGSAADIPEWVKKVGHEIVGSEQVGNVWHIKVRKAK